MSTLFPSGLDSFTPKADLVDDVLAAHVNDLQDAVLSLQTKVGISNSGATSSLDYLLRNASSIDPGHRHSSASLDALAYTKLTYTGLTANHALMASGASAASFRQIQETDLADNDVFARLTSPEIITGVWDFNNGLLSRGELKFMVGSAFVGFEPPASVTGNVTWRLPSGEGTSGQALVTNGAGVLSWATVSGSATPSGADGTLQYNNGGSLGGSLGTVWNDATNRLGLGVSPVSSKLHVRAATSTEHSLVVDTNGLSDPSDIVFAVDGNARTRLRYQLNRTAFLVTTTALGIAVASMVKALEIDNGTGRVSILTGTHNTELTVQGAADIAYSLRVGSGGYPTATLDVNGNADISGRLELGTSGDGYLSVRDTATVAFDAGVDQLRIADKISLNFTNANTVTAGFADVGLARGNTERLRVTLGQDMLSYPQEWGDLEVRDLYIYNNSNGYRTRLRFSGAADINYVWPSTAPTNTYVLSSDGSGNLSWVAPGGSGGGTYLGLTDTPGSFTARAIPHVNTAGSALAHSANLTYDDTTDRLKAIGNTKFRLGASDVDNGWLNVSINDTDEAAVFEHTGASPVKVVLKNTTRAWGLTADDSPDVFALSDDTAGVERFLITGNNGHALLRAADGTFQLRDNSASVFGVSLSNSTSVENEYTGIWLKADTDADLTANYKGALLFRRDGTSNGRGSLLLSVNGTADTSNASTSHAVLEVLPAQVSLLSGMKLRAYDSTTATAQFDGSASGAKTVLLVGHGSQVGFNSAAAVTSGAADVGLIRAQANHLRVTDGTVAGFGTLEATRFRLDNGSGTAVLEFAVGGAATTTVYTWPSAPDAGKVLSTDGSGTLSWATAGTGTVTGPGTSTTTALARWDGAGGTALSDSNWTLASAGWMAANIVRTTTTSNEVGLQLETYANPGSNRTGDLTAVYGRAGVTAGNAQTSNADYIGVHGFATHGGTGGLNIGATLTGVYGVAETLSTGDLSQAFGVRALVRATGSGSVISAAYGVYIEDSNAGASGTVTSRWGLYQVGTENNRFSGPLGIKVNPEASTTLTVAHNSAGSGTVFKFTNTDTLLTMLWDGSVDLTPQKSTSSSGENVAWDQHRGWDPNSGSHSGSLIGMRVKQQVSSTASESMTNATTGLIGGQFFSQHFGSGTVARSCGLEVKGEVTVGAGTVTDMLGLQVGLTVGASCTATNLTTLLINEVSNSGSIGTVFALLQPGADEIVALYASTILMPSLPSAAGTNIVSTIGGLALSTSSRRFKDDILTLSERVDTEKLWDLRPVSFRWNEKSACSGRLDFGLIAEEVEEVYPEMVTKDAAGDPFSVNYAQLSVLLLEELKTLRGRVAALEAGEV